MITVMKSGTYKLIETKSCVKILSIDDDTFAWVAPRNIGQVLVVSHVPHRTDKSLAMGGYILYKIDDEPYLTDLQHLELEFGRNAWQGYLLPTGFSNVHKKRSRIIPTMQIITGNPRFSTSMDFIDGDRDYCRIVQKY